MSDRERAVALVALDPFDERLSVRPQDAGPFRTGGVPSPGRFTTIAWRLCHIGDLLREKRSWRWLGREPTLRDADIRHPRTAAGGIDHLGRSWAAWQELLASVAADELFVVHVMDELIHHGAEIGVVRDLYAGTVRP